MANRLDCTLNESGCIVESDLCDAEDDNGTLTGTILTGSDDGHDDSHDHDHDDDSRPTCTDELEACQVSTTCEYPYILTCFTQSILKASLRLQVNIFGRTRTTRGSVTRKDLSLRPARGSLTRCISNMDTLLAVPSDHGLM